MNIIIENIGWFLLAITIATVYLYKYFTNDQDALTAKHVITISLPKSEPNFHNKVLLALKESGFKKVGCDMQEGRYYAKTGFTFWSFGENIQILVEQEQNLIIFKSICVLPTQMIAWGKNKRNAARFLSNFKTTT